MIQEYEQLEKMKAQLEAYKERPDYKRVSNWYKHRAKAVVRSHIEEDEARSKGRPLRILLTSASIVLLLSALLSPDAQATVAIKLVLAAALYAAYIFLNHRNTESLPQVTDFDAVTDKEIGYSLTDEQRSWYQSMRDTEAAIKAKKREIDEREQLVAVASANYNATHGGTTAPTAIASNTTAEARRMNRKNPTICPKCGSSNTAFLGKKGGVSVGRAIVGGAVFGVAGAAVGAATGKKKEMICRDCGHRWTFK